MTTPFQVVRADLAGNDVREQMAEIFADGFGQWLSYFSEDRKVLARAFAHMFVLDQYYVALKDGQVAAFGACTDCRTLSVRLDRRLLRKHLGWLRGTMAAMILKSEFEKPFDNPPDDTGSIEFVGTALSFRGQGAATRLIQHILRETPYSRYIIEEVADTNEPAMRLYAKLGFKEYKRKANSTRAAKKSGVNHVVSLRWDNRLQEVDLQANKSSQ